jgi:hypothetical protein
MKVQQHSVNADDTWTSAGESMENMASDLGINVSLYARLATVKMEMMFQGIINNVVIGLFKGVAYCLFFITVIILYILACVGPISLAFSISGAFKDSWIHWAGKVIAVSFYPAIGYIVLNISCAVLNYGLKQVINRLQQLNAETDQAFWLNAILHTDFYLIYLFIAIVIAIAGIASTPLISTWFINSQGAGNMASAFTRAPGQIASTAKKLIGK